MKERKQGMKRERIMKRNILSDNHHKMNRAAH